MYVFIYIIYNIYVTYIYYIYIKLDNRIYSFVNLMSICIELSEI